MSTVKVQNTSRKRVEATVAGVVRTVPATPLDAAERKATGRTYPQGVSPDENGNITEVYTHRLVAEAGQTVEVPVEAWEKFDANGAAQTFGLVVVEDEAPEKPKAKKAPAKKAPAKKAEGSEAPAAPAV